MIFNNVIYEHYFPIHQVLRSLSINPSLSTLKNVYYAEDEEVIEHLFRRLAPNINFEA